MKTVAFYVNETKPHALAICRSLRRQAVRLGLKVAQNPAEANAVVVLGGDGTMLSAVHAFPGVPLLGLNLGTLGFLAGAEGPDFKDVLRALVDGAYTLSRRSMLACSLFSGKRRVSRVRALNEVVVSRGEGGHAAAIDLAVDGCAATQFAADGLIIATPTGSTAYSLAAGGPILTPDSQVFVVTPISPHALSSRPVVVRDTARFTVSLPAQTRAPLAVFADGAPVATLTLQDTLEIAKAPQRATLIELTPADPFRTLARKLGWRGSAATP